MIEHLHASATKADALLGQATHLDFQAISADDPEGYLQLASGDSFNSSSARNDQLLQALPLPFSLQYRSAF